MVVWRKRGHADIGRVIERIAKRQLETHFGLTKDGPKKVDRF